MDEGNVDSMPTNSSKQLKKQVEEVKAPAENNGKTADGRFAAGNEYAFKPGQSGNPGGRPKKKPITEAYERYLEDPAKADELVKASTQNIIDGKRGGPAFLKEMTDRTEGKVTDKLEVGGLDGVVEAIASARRRAGIASGESVTPEEESVGE